MCYIDTNYCLMRDPSLGEKTDSVKSLVYVGALILTIFHSPVFFFTSG